MEKDYGSWSLADLKAELRKRKAKVTGRKAALVQRLLDYDSMFGELINDPDTAYRIELPEPSFFFDVASNTTLPCIQEEDIQAYAVLGERSNLATSKNMYEEYYLLAVRAAKQGNVTFITAVCAAEMRKSIVYNIVIKLQENTIEECQCECTAGMGPYAQCKHVLVVLYGLHQFSQVRKIKLRLSQTSTLQVFHQPRAYTGNPVTAEKIKLRLKDSTLKTVTNFDPTSNSVPVEKFQETFKNNIVNYTATTQDNMPMGHLTSRAEKAVVECDHQYLECDPAEVYLKSLCLSQEEIDELEKRTKVDKKKWENERRMRMQSSNFGKICKAKSNQIKIAKSIMKNITVMCPAIKYGIKNEKNALKKFMEQTKFKVIKCGLFICKDYQFLASTPDGLVDEDGVIEVKCPFSATDKYITPETVPYIYLCENTGGFVLKEDHDYFYQVQGQLLCTGRKICYFCVYTKKDFIIIKIIRNEEFIAGMLENLKLFYNNFYKALFLSRYYFNKKI